MSRRSFELMLVVMAVVIGGAKAGEPKPREELALVLDNYVANLASLNRFSCKFSYRQHYVRDLKSAIRGDFGKPMFDAMPWSGTWVVDGKKEIYTFGGEPGAAYEPLKKGETKGVITGGSPVTISLSDGEYFLETDHGVARLHKRNVGTYVVAGPCPFNPLDQGLNCAPSAERLALIVQRAVNGVGTFKQIARDNPFVKGLVYYEIDDEVNIHIIGFDPKHGYMPAYITAYNRATGKPQGEPDAGLYVTEFIELPKGRFFPKRSITFYSGADMPKGGKSVVAEYAVKELSSDEPDKSVFEVTIPVARCQFQGDTDKAIKSSRAPITVTLDNIATLYDNLHSDPPWIDDPPAGNRRGKMRSVSFLVLTALCGMTYLVLRRRRRKASLPVSL